jgi:hypothetical protein
MISRIVRIIIALLRQKIQLIEKVRKQTPKFTLNSMKVPLCIKLDSMFEINNGKVVLNEVLYDKGGRIAVIRENVLS